MAGKKSNAVTPKPAGKTPAFTQQNTPRHKLLAMGQDAGVAPKGRPSTGP